VSRPADRCPKCGCKTSVLRNTKDGPRVVRERACRDCGYRYSTVEERAERGWMRLA